MPESETRKCRCRLTQTRCAALSVPRQERVVARRVALHVGLGDDAGDALETGARVLGIAPLRAARVVLAVVNALCPSRRFGLIYDFKARAAISKQTQTKLPLHFSQHPFFFSSM